MSKKNKVAPQELPPLRHLFSYYNYIFPKRWSEPCLSDYMGQTEYTYQTLAEQIATLHELFRRLGIRRGDKVALCGRNCANWAVSYLAITTYGAVIVSILQDFHAKEIIHLINHSDARALLVGPYVWQSIAGKQDYTQEQINEIASRLTPGLNAIVSFTDFHCIYAKTEADLQVEPVSMTADRFHFEEYPLDDLMLINYTSGSTGSPKGVMLTYRSLSGNVASGMQFLPPTEGDRLVSMLPLAHAFGQLAEFLFPLAAGCHIFFLSKTPTPTILLRAFADVKPYMIVTVPLVIEKICKKAVFPITNKATMQRLWRAPIIGSIIRRKVKSKLMKSFGGKVKYFIVGGAAINPEVEALLLDIHFPFVVGYGMTECGPLIGGCYVKEFVRRSAGHILPRNEIRIDSEDPYNVVGEILIKGDHVMKGYYKNEEATRNSFTKDGWLRTGDLGVIDKDKNIFIRGRNKNMILGASGQNIYPEEIEDKLNNMAMVQESIVVEREGKLIALVFPELKGELEFSQSLLDLMKENLQKLNELLPKYSQISKIELQQKEFEKTPKKSIKRFLYK